MAPDEYSAGGGGKLKLKGSKVSDGRVEKKKKKSKKKDAEASADAKRELNDEVKDRDAGEREKDASPGSEGTPEAGYSSAGKTETEKKYEEVRKKRLHERLQREGSKTHKERVEELNKYLSRLSEHHDMPKIGPG